ncbi:hypothetical protein, partial [Stieleria mannarensis]|uniref:hypothetical protein n=1 Tax=Stieleria mannarensis TaxID=2755585 RepID=UPI001C726E5C
QELDTQQRIGRFRNSDFTFRGSVNAVALALKIEKSGNERRCSRLAFRSESRTKRCTPSSRIVAIDGPFHRYDTCPSSPPTGWPVSGVIVIVRAASPKTGIQLLIFLYAV